jgi:hypothetical protein
MSDGIKNQKPAPKIGIFKRHPFIFRMTLLAGGMSLAYITMHLFFIDYLKKSDQIIQKEIQDLKAILQTNQSANIKTNKPTQSLSELSENKKL